MVKRGSRAISTGISIYNIDVDIPKRFKFVKLPKMAVVLKSDENAQFPEVQLSVRHWPFSDTVLFQAIRESFRRMAEESNKIAEYYEGLQKEWTPGQLWKYRQGRCCFSLLLLCLRCQRSQDRQEKETSPEEGGPALWLYHVLSGGT